MSRRSCYQAAEGVYLYLDGEIGWYRRMKINWHLRSCSRCEGAYYFEDRLRSIVREKCAEDIPDDVMERLRNLLRGESA